MFPPSTLSSLESTYIDGTKGTRTSYTQCCPTCDATTVCEPGEARARGGGSNRGRARALRPSPASSHHFPLFPPQACGKPTDPPPPPPPAQTTTTTTGGTGGSGGGGCDPSVECSCVAYANLRGSENLVQSDLETCEKDPAEMCYGWYAPRRPSVHPLLLPTGREGAATPTHARRSTPPCSPCGRDGRARPPTHHTHAGAPDARPTLPPRPARYNGAQCDGMKKDKKLNTDLTGTVGPGGYTGTKSGCQAACAALGVEGCCYYVTGGTCKFYDSDVRATGSGYGSNDSNEWALQVPPTAAARTEWDRSSLRSPPPRRHCHRSLRSDPRSRPPSLQCYGSDTSSPATGSSGTGSSGTGSTYSTTGGGTGGTGGTVSPPPSCEVEYSNQWFAGEHMPRHCHHHRHCLHERRRHHPSHHPFPSRCSAVPGRGVRGVE